MLIFDAHLDLSMNALEWNRDLTRPLAEIRAREKRLTDKPDRGRNTVCFPEMRRAHIGLCVATQIARFVAPDNPLNGWHSPEQAWAQTQGQLAYYKAMEAAGQMVQITNADQLDLVVSMWGGGRREEGGEAPLPPPSFPLPPPSTLPVGYILSLEGADSILTPHHLERAYEQGLRALGPAHYGPGRYAMGTDATGGLRPGGKDLLKEMDRLGIILDATHLCDDCFWEALEIFKGPVWASHNNCRALVAHNRQFSDEQLKALIARGAVIGAALDAWMLVPGWIRKQTTPQSANLKLEQLLDHTDHINQLAGNANHTGIGSDLDGAFGTEQTPMDLESIADLARLPDMLKKRGYCHADVEKIAHGNFVRFLKKAWGET
ncbi:MAG TPA: membrane dipeptidase [Planctomycetota bacterium]|nr:membrane dipeptidase [Planctomycetota bacterium]